MKHSIKGFLLPESLGDYHKLTAMGEAQATSCGKCRMPFSELNVKTAAGWRDTQIIRMCETCFDGLFPSEYHGPEDGGGDAMQS